MSVTVHPRLGSGRRRALLRLVGGLPRASVGSRRPLRSAAPPASSAAVRPASAASSACGGLLAASLRLRLDGRLEQPEPQRQQGAHQQEQAEQHPEQPLRDHRGLHVAAVELDGGAVLGRRRRRRTDGSPAVRARSGAARLDLAPTTNLASPGSIDEPDRVDLEPDPLPVRGAVTRTFTGTLPRLSTATL